MHCELVVPGLFAAAAAGRLPAVELLLARGRCTGGSAETYETWLRDAFELDVPLPAGALTLLAGGGDPGGDWWIRADPVHLRLMRDRLVFVPSAALRIQRTEADALCETLSRHFGSDLQVQVVDAERWIVRTAGGLAVSAQPPLQLAGRDVTLAMPPTASALLNEAQMVLHAHPVNEAREARGEPTVNSLWFWGEGRAPRVASKRWRSVTADEPLALGLARAAKLPYRTLPASAAAWLERAPEDGRHLLTLDALRVPLALAETGDYRDAVNRLERDWFAPLLAALRGGRIGMVTIHVPDAAECLAYETTRGDLRRFWRRPKALESYGMRVSA